MNRLTDMTWTQAETALKGARLAILPTGSIEQHGPHLTLETDTVIAANLAAGLARELGTQAVLLPRLDYGLSEHHLHFPGTLTLRPESYLRVLADIVESLVHWGQRRILVVNGHGGNIDALRLASRSARRDQGALVASVMWAQVASDEIASRVHSTSYGHACESETSVAMAIAPEVVRPDAIDEPGERYSVDRLTDPPGAIVDQTLMLHQWSSDGALGDPRLATAELGQTIVDTVMARTLEFARRLMDQPLPPLEGERS